MNLLDYIYSQMSGHGNHAHYKPDGPKVGIGWFCSTGSARYENGGLYEGSFSADVRAGWGTHSFPDGSRYEGEWAGDKMHGRRP